MGRTARRTLLRPERRWRIPLGIGRGLRIRVDAAAPVHRYVGSAELELSRHVRRFVVKGAVCFDVGGYDGYYALVFARLSGARVWCFEADGRRAGRIGANLALNKHLGRRVCVLATFLCDRRGDEPRTDTLDDLIARGAVPTPQFMKIDVEGAEVSVLRGAADMLRHKKPDLIVETHSEQLDAECVTLLSAAGYACSFVTPRRLFRENRGAGHNRWIVATSRNSVGLIAEGTGVLFRAT